MNNIVAAVKLENHATSPINEYGIQFMAADALIPGDTPSSDVRLRLLCFNQLGPRLETFGGWEPGKKCLITGSIVFTDEKKDRLDVIVSTITPGIPDTTYVNQVSLGSAFFGTGFDQIKVQKTGNLAISIGILMDESDTKTWLSLECHESRKQKLQERARKGRPLSVVGSIREYRTDDRPTPYRAIICHDFSTRKEAPKSSGTTQKEASRSGYQEASVDPTPVIEFAP